MVSADSCVSGTETISISLAVNGADHSLVIEARDTLAEVLRDRLDLIGTKISCNLQVCGACTVLVDTRAVSACNVLAYQADGAHVLTIEGVAGPEAQLDPIQQAFVDTGAMQCGFCMPGMVVMTRALLADNPDPTRQQVEDHLEGNLCRCTGYQMIIEAVLAAAQTVEDAQNRELSSL